MYQCIEEIPVFWVEKHYSDCKYWGINWKNWIPVKKVIILNLSGNECKANP